MVENKIISKYSVGPGTNYVVENQSAFKTGLMFQLTDTTRKKEFTFEKHNSYVEINKIINGHPKNNLQFVLMIQYLLKNPGVPS